MQYLLNHSIRSSNPNAPRPDSFTVPFLHTHRPGLVTFEGVSVHGELLKLQRITQTGEWGGIYRFRYFTKGRHWVRDGLYDVHRSGQKLHERKLFDARPSV
jgi:hypothetical protein